MLSLLQQFYHCVTGASSHPVLSASLALQYLQEVKELRSDEERHLTWPDSQPNLKDRTSKRRLRGHVRPSTSFIHFMQLLILIP